MSHGPAAQNAHPDVGCARFWECTMANPLARSINAVVINHDLIKAYFLENNTFFDQSGELTCRFDWILTEESSNKGGASISTALATSTRLET